MRLLFIFIAAFAIGAVSGEVTTLMACVRGAMIGLIFCVGEWFGKSEAQS